MPDSKVCTKCGEEKPATAEFWPTHQGKLKTPCRACKLEYLRVWQEANREHRLDYARQYRNDHPELIAERNRQQYESNREQRIARARAYRAEYPDRVAACNRRYSQAHPDVILAHSRNRKARVRGAEGSHTAADITAQYKRQNGRCFYCHETLDKYHVDHVVPLALGGSNGPENLVVACASCNQAKHTAHPMDFAGVML